MDAWYVEADMSLKDSELLGSVILGFCTHWICSNILSSTTRIVK